MPDGSGQKLVRCFINTSVLVSVRLACNTKQGEAALGQQNRKYFKDNVLQGWWSPRGSLTHAHGCEVQCWCVCSGPSLHLPEFFTHLHSPVIGKVLPSGQEGQGKGNRRGTLKQAAIPHWSCRCRSHVLAPNFGRDQGPILTDGCGTEQGRRGQETEGNRRALETPPH